jgi:hypothetical protein
MSRRGRYPLLNEKKKAELLAILSTGCTRLTRIIHKSGTNVPPVAFKVLVHKHFNADTEAHYGFADCFSVHA